MDNSIRQAFEAILPPEERARRLKGRELDGYILGEMMGEGGFGVVYHAEHPQMGKAAIKVLAVDVKDNPREYERFQKEIDILISANKVPNVVGIRHAGRVDDMPYCVMEWVDGITLHRWLRTAGKSDKKAARKQFIEIIVGILNGLDGLDKVQSASRTTREVHPPEASEQMLPDCIVHRDITPSNIMVEEVDGGGLKVTLIDFGIAGVFKTGAKAGTLMTQMTLSTMTPEYASPEMCLSPESLDVRSDLFQAGLLAFEIITGEIYWKVRCKGKDKPEANLIKAKKYPRWLKGAILRSLRWNRDERYSTASEFRHKLTHPLRHELHPSELWRRRSRTVAVATSILAVGLAIAIFVTNRQLKQSKADAAALQTESAAYLETNNKLRIENETFQASLSGDAPVRQAKLKEIEDLYGVLESGQAERTKVIALRDKCKEFVVKYPTYDFVAKVQNLNSWLDSYLKGSLRIVPEQFVNKGYRNKTMHYKVMIGDKEMLQHQGVVHGPLYGSGVYNLQFDEHQTVTLGWDGVVTTQIVFDTDGKPGATLDVGMLRAETFREGNERAVTIQAKDDTDYTLLVKIERIGFGALPPKP